MYKIVFPESDNAFVKTAVAQLKDSCQPILLEHNLEAATKMLAQGEADAMVAGIDYASRDVILATHDQIGLRDGFSTFSSLFFCKIPDGKSYIVADGATCRQPSTEQLAEIILLVHEAALKLLDETPRIAMLSFSTFGSGVGKKMDSTIEKIRSAIDLALQRNPDMLIDGEMQLDAAVNPRVADKKAQAHPSAVAGRANVLITPDINSGNILYKSLEQFAHATVAGPILLGFKAPVSDLSRGSTAADVLLTTESVIKLI